MSKIENSVWRCTWKVPSSETGECDVTLIQQEMERHMIVAHGSRDLKPADVIANFVLVRTAEVPRGPGRRKAVKDTTEPMFSREDFR